MWKTWEHKYPLNVLMNAANIFQCRVNVKLTLFPMPTSKHWPSTGTTFNSPHFFIHPSNHSFTSSIQEILVQCFSKFAPRNPEFWRLKSLGNPVLVNLISNILLIKIYTLLSMYVSFAVTLQFTCHHKASISGSVQNEASW